MNGAMRKSRLRRLGAMIGDDAAVAMLEFCLVAPLLSYLIVANLFVQNHIDYAMDSASRYGPLGWRNVYPDVARVVSSPNRSDDDAFFTVPLRPGLQLAVLLGLADGTTGSIWAAQTMAGFGGEVPYETYRDSLSDGMRADNYKMNYEPLVPFAVADGGWGKVMGLIGTFFATRIGTGDFAEPEGLQSGWEDRYPYAVEPWMRKYSEDWDPARFMPWGIPLEYFPLYIMTILRTPVPRVDNRDNIDIGSSNLDNDRYEFTLLSCFDEESCTSLQLTRVNGKSAVLEVIE